MEGIPEGGSDNDCFSVTIMLILHPTGSSTIIWKITLKKLVLLQKVYGVKFSPMIEKTEDRMKQVSFYSWLIKMKKKKNMLFEEKVLRILLVELTKKNSVSIAMIFVLHSENTGQDECCVQVNQILTLKLLNNWLE